MAGKKKWILIDRESNGISINSMILRKKKLREDKEVEQGELKDSNPAVVFENI